MIQLIPFSRKDFTLLKEWIDSNELLVQWSGNYFSYPLDAEQLEQHYLETQKENPSLYAFTVINDRGEPIGHIELTSYDLLNQSAVVSRVFIAPEHRGRGYAQQMMREILRFGFEEHSPHKISLRVFDFNQAAITCYKKVGFIEEGILRDQNRVGNDYWNLIVMSMLEEEYQAKYC